MEMLWICRTVTGRERHGNCFISYFQRVIFHGSFGLPLFTPKFIHHTFLREKLKHRLPSSTDS